MRMLCKLAGRIKYNDANVFVFYIKLHDDLIVIVVRFDTNYISIGCVFVKDTARFL